MAFVVGATAFLAVVFTRNVWVYLLAPPLVGLLFAALTQPWAYHFVSGPVTLWDIALYLTPHRECQEAGYRLSKRELSAKVRLIVSENLGVPLDRLTPETSFIDDLGAD